MAHRGAGEIRADVTVTGDAVGQLARGRNTLRMRVDRVRGNAVTVRPAAAAGVVLRWVRFPPGPRGPVFGRDDEVEQVLAELTAYGSVALQAPPGMGATTVLRHLAHHPALAAAYGGVVCLSALGTCPATTSSRPSSPRSAPPTCRCGPPSSSCGELLRPARAAVLLDDVELSAADVAELQYLLPNCGFVFAGRNVGGAMRSVEARGGSRSTPRASCSRTSSASRWSAAWCTRCGASPAAPPRPSSSSASARARTPRPSSSPPPSYEGPPPFAVDSPQDRRLLGAARRGARRRALR